MKMDPTNISLREMLDPIPFHLFVALEGLD